MLASVFLCVAILYGLRKIGLDAIWQMSYSRRLKESLSLLYAAIERDWYRVYLIHVDGSASGNSATTGYLRTTKRLAAYMEVGGTLRIHFGAPNAAASPPRLRSVQSLPE
jgi:hypothetical protein